MTHEQENEFKNRRKIKQPTHQPQSRRLVPNAEVGGWCILLENVMILWMPNTVLPVQCIIVLARCYVSTGIYTEIARLHCNLSRATEHHRLLRCKGSIIPRV